MFQAISMESCRDGAALYLESCDHMTLSLHCQSPRVGTKMMDAKSCHSRSFYGYVRPFNPVSALLVPAALEIGNNEICVSHTSQYQPRSCLSSLFLLVLFGGGGGLFLKEETFEFCTENVSQPHYFWVTSERNFKLDLLNQGNAAMLHAAGNPAMHGNVAMQQGILDTQSHSGLPG